MSNHWHTILNLIQEGSLRISTLSKETGIRANKISVWKAQGTTPKYEDYLVLKDWLQKKHPDLVVQDATVNMKRQDMAAMLLELSAKMTVLQSSMAELLSNAYGQPFEAVAQTMKDAEQNELQALQSKFG